VALAHGERFSVNRVGNGTAEASSGYLHRELQVCHWTLVTPRLARRVLAGHGSDILAHLLSVRYGKTHTAQGVVPNDCNIRVITSAPLLPMRESLSS
jgi:hypothetical protein